MNFCTVTKLFLHFSTVYGQKDSLEDSAECFPEKIHGIFRLVSCLVKSNYNSAFGRIVTASGFCPSQNVSIPFRGQENSAAKSQKISFLTVQNRRLYETSSPLYNSGRYSRPAAAGSFS